jgi:broad specificity phosphatase PhoE
VTTIYLVRHGETDWNAEARWQGHADPPLNGRGREQARALEARLADVPFEAVYSSDLRRARETAEIVAAGRDLAIVLDPALREIDVGPWEGLTNRDVAERFPGGERPGGETIEAFRERVLEAIREICRRHDGGNVLVVAHGGCARTIQRHLLGDALPTLENCGLYLIRSENGVLRPAGSRE